MHRPLRSLGSGLVLLVAFTACADTPSPPPVTQPSVRVSRDAGTTTETTPTATPSPASPTSTPSPPPPVRTYVSSESLAIDLGRAERVIRAGDVPDDQLRGWAHVQQSAIRQLHDHPEWVPEVRAALPPGLRPALDANLHAQEQLFGLTAPKEELPRWRIVPAPDPETLLTQYREAADEYGIDWTHLAAIHFVETRMGRIRGISTAGAQGPMQFIPSTWEAYGEGDVNDPGDAIRAAARYLADHGAPGDMHAAIWAYNHSDRYVEAVQAYADVMREEPATYHGYYNWQVTYRLVSGDVVLEEGWVHPDAD